MKIVRASEVGTFLYCQRAWWYTRQGYESENLSELAEGSHIHEQHGRVVMLSGCLRLAAYILILASMVLLSIWMVRALF